MLVLVNLSRSRREEHAGDAREATAQFGHTRGKQVVPRAEALARVRAAVDARDEGTDILILVRTDIVGFDDYDAEAERYCLEDEGPP